MAIKIYCEHGAFREELFRFQQHGYIELVNFPYEMRIRKKHNMGRPSDVKIADMGNVYLADANWQLCDMEGSDKLNHIRHILGPRTRRDALHVDSAYKSGCAAFLSRDRKHILSKARELKQLLGIIFFHPDDDWNEFQAFIGTSDERA